MLSKHISLIRNKQIVSSYCVVNTNDSFKSHIQSQEGKKQTQVWEWLCHSNATHQMARSSLL